MVKLIAVSLNILVFTIYVTWVILNLIIMNDDGVCGPKWKKTKTGQLMEDI